MTCNIWLFANLILNPDCMFIKWMRIMRIGQSCPYFNSPPVNCIFLNHIAFQKFFRKFRIHRQFDKMKEYIRWPIKNCQICIAFVATGMDGMIVLQIHYPLFHSYLILLLCTLVNILPNFNFMLLGVSNLLFVTWNAFEHVFNRMAITQSYGKY